MRPNNKRHIFHLVQLRAGLLIVTQLFAHNEPVHRPLSLKESRYPYRGHVVNPMNNGAIHRNVMCGDQGWFRATCEDDGMGFRHWEDEKVPVNDRYPDSRRACAFSSSMAKTILGHFRWMQDYGIDGVVVQRVTSASHNLKNNHYLNSDKTDDDQHLDVAADLINTEKDHVRILDTVFSYLNRQGNGFGLPDPDKCHDPDEGNDVEQIQVWLTSREGANLGFAEREITAWVSSLFR
ncbi:MAG: hypothetical protein D6820_16995 [Lentisphaerae bacterium]|nr:MAG: hypothetical protein D6820_16995 [Lentisphaerota bacterium]